jgi:hypothetical protein
MLLLGNLKERDQLEVIGHHEGGGDVFWDCVEWIHVAQESLSPST